MEVYLKPLIVFLKSFVRLLLAEILVPVIAKAARKWLEMMEERALDKLKSKKVLFESEDYESAKAEIGKAKEAIESVSKLKTKLKGVKL